MKAGTFRKGAIVFLYACATLQAARYYAIRTDFYLKLAAYLQGHERLPFQQRVLPILFLRAMYNSSWVTSHFHHNGAFTQTRGPFYVLSLISLVVAGLFTQKLYNAVTERGILRPLVYPLFLFTVLWTYAIHIEADFSYPYDLPSLAFFTAGLYFIYQRKFWALLAVVLVGSFNRETTLFLIGIYVIDRASTATFSRTSEPGERRFDLRRVPWVRVALLAVVWGVIHVALKRMFHGNDATEDFLRIHYNLEELTPRFVPALLNICGYSLPVVLLFHERLTPVRYRNYLYILPLWIVVMFCSGVLVETRIYGELCSYSAIAVVLILENYLSEPRGPAVETPVEEEVEVPSLVC